MANPLLSGSSKPKSTKQQFGPGFWVLIIGLVMVLTALVTIYLIIVFAFK